MRYPSRGLRRRLLPVGRPAASRLVGRLDTPPLAKSKISPRTALHAALILLLCAPVSCRGRGEPGSVKVLPGIDTLRAEGFRPLRGKRVGLITNPTGVDSELRSTLDILSGAPDVRLVALFGPEHGVRGDHAAGQDVESYVDPPTGLPVYSLYGKTRKPTPAMLDALDALVYDIQDIGCRSYTFISTLGLAMEAAAESGIDFVVLDRPNPLGGRRVEGNLVDPGFESFVAPYPIPYVYGMTCGELARLLNDEGLLAGGARCKLTVVPMKGWRREMTFRETGLSWVPTSPHIPTEDTPAYYVSTGILGELGVISEGVGYTLPFRTLAAEWIDPALMASKLNGLGLPGVRFRPITFQPFYGLHAGKTLRGVELHLSEDPPVDLVSLQFLFLQAHHELYPERNPFEIAKPSRVAAFDRVLGTDRVRKRFCDRMRYEDIRGEMTGAVGAFRAKAQKYYLY
jgi:uncharacterized protein YbbC (DUF1343 family)